MKTVEEDKLVIQGIAGICDSQSVKNTDTGGSKECDGGKKISGIKRYILVHTNSLPIDTQLTPANEPEQESLFHMFTRQEERGITLDTVYTDGGYTGEDLHLVIYLETGTHIETVKRSKNHKHQFSVLPKRVGGSKDGLLPEG